MNASSAFLDPVTGHLSGGRLQVFFAPGIDAGGHPNLSLWSINVEMFGTILMYVLALAPKVVLGIQTVYGDAKAGATKKKMAQDALTAAATGAASVIAPGTDQAAEAQLAAQAVGVFINAMDPITDAVNATRANGSYQTATKTAAATQKAAADLKAANAKPAPAPVPDEPQAAAEEHLYTDTMK